MVVVNPEMLILAREWQGLSQGELATKSGLSQSQVSKFELGVRVPSDEQLEAIADALVVPVEFFELTERRYSFGSSCTYHRRQSALSAQTLRAVLARLNRLRIDVRHMLSNLDFEPQFELPKYDIDDCQGGVRQIAGLVRRALHVPPGPIKNLVEVIESAGGVVCVSPFGTRKLDAVSQWAPGMPPVFLVNSEAPVDRQRFTLAHELGHLVMHSSPSLDMEREADQFAAEFLMPASDIEPYLERMERGNLTALKIAWRVSMAALVRRAYDLNKITEKQYRYMNVMLSKMGYRTREPDILEAEQPKLLGSIFNAYTEGMGYERRDLCKLLRHKPETLYKEYGIGDPVLRVG